MRVLIVGLLALVAAATAVGLSRAGTGDDDPYGDLVIGVPGEDWGTTDPDLDVGVAHVLYPDAGRVITGSSEFWRQGYNGLSGALEPDDLFGEALAAGDFDGDGYTDLAVGTPSEGVALLEGGTAANAGAVYVIYASPTGLTGADDAVLDQDGLFLDEDAAAEENDFFGQALAAGDFNNDGYDDLAVGIPGEDLELTGVEDAGAVHVFYGSSLGIMSEGNEVWDQGRYDIAGSANTGDRFGSSLAAGDFDRDGYDDLAIGIPYESLGGPDQYGSVQVLYGAPNVGLAPDDNQVWFQGITLEDAGEDLDVFGWALAVGDFDGDSYDDLAVGAPGEDLENGTTVANAGVVHVIYGASSGLCGTDDELWTQADIETAASEDGDRFGRALAAGDFNADGYADLAIGVPYEDYSLGGPPSEWTDCGCFNVLLGTAGGMWEEGDGTYCWYQGATMLEDGRGDYDHFGDVLAAGDIDSDGYDDLVVGIPDEDLVIDSTTYQDAGAVQVFYGCDTTFSGAEDLFLHQGMEGFSGSSVETDDYFGGAVAILHITPQHVYLPLVVRD